MCRLVFTLRRCLFSCVGIVFAEVGRKIGEAWSKLTDDDKVKYVKLAEEDKARYEREKAEYEKKSDK